MNTRPTIKLLVLLCLFVLGTAHGPVFGQTQPPKWQDDFEKYVDHFAPMLGADEFASIKRGRDALIRPFDEGDFGTGERLSKGRLVIAQTRDHLKSDREIVRINAMRVIGELGTDESVHLLIGFLDDKQATARHMAVFAIGRAFRTALDPARPAAMNADATKQVIRDLAQGLENEEVSLIVDAYVRTFDAASAITSPNLSEIPPLALTELTDAIGRRVQKMNEAVQDLHLARAYLRASTLVRDRLADPRIRVSKEMARKVSAIAGHLLAYVLHDVRANINAEIDPDYRRTQINICKSTHAIIGLAHDRLDPVNVQRANQIGRLRPAKSLENNDLDGFVQVVGTLIGPPGILTDEPFGYPDAAFLK